MFTIAKAVAATRASTANSPRYRCLRMFAATGMEAVSRSAQWLRMDRRLREKVTKQWGWIGDSDPREHAKARLLELDLEGSPLRGRPLPARFRLGAVGVDSYVAALGGPLPYMQRLREIERLAEEHARDLMLAREELAAECDGDGLRRAMARRRGGVALRRRQLADRDAQPLLPRRVATADGSSHRRFRADRRPDVQA